MHLGAQSSIPEQGMAGWKRKLLLSSPLIAYTPMTLLIDIFSLALLYVLATLFAGV